MNNRNLNQKKVLKKFTATFITIIFVAVSTLSPVVPILKFPSSNDESIKLGFEIKSAEASFGNGYNYRRSITINESQVTGGSNFTDFPVLASFSEPEFRTTGNGGKVTDAQGDDIVFASDDQGATPLDFERERYNASTGEITAWVRVPTLDFNDNTVIYMFYGNSSVTTSQEDVANTWDTNYKGVWHMDDSGATNSDSAGTANDGSVSGATAGAAGKFGPAYDFDGVNDVSTVTDHADLDITNTGTIEAWFKTDDTNGSESNFSSWVSRNAPNSAGLGDQSGVDTVIVGEVLHYGGFFCLGSTGDFGYSTSSLDQSTFKNWDMTTFTAPAGCGDGEGGMLGVDSDGVRIYYAALATDGGATAFQTASSTLDYVSVSTWRNENDLSAGSTGTNEGSGIDMVIVGNTAYYQAIGLNQAVETVASTTRTVGSAEAMTWSQDLTIDFGGAIDASCETSIDSDGDKLYRSVLCNPATEVYKLSSSTVGATTPITWVSEVAPNGSAAAEYGDTDMAAMGGRLFHTAGIHNAATEAYQTASSSMSSGGTLSWVSRQDGSSLPDGMSGTAGDSMTASVASDGKNMYYSTFIASSTSERFYTASSTLPAHPFISKRNAYEMIQVGQGLAFDWAGRPYTFGTSTDTTGFDHIVVTQDGTTLNMYENGVLRRTQTTSVDFESNANNLLIGAGNRSDGTSIYFDGIVDEVRVSSSARSADWILTGYNNQNSTSTFYTLGAEVSGDTAPTATTNFATPGATSAVLNGTKTGGSNATQHGFAYSTDPTLTIGVSTTTLGALNANSSFQSAVSPLSADQTYYFRAYATNAVGTGYGTIKSFVTGNSTSRRKLRLFEGSKVKFIGGRVILHQE